MSNMDAERKVYWALQFLGTQQLRDFLENYVPVSFTQYLKDTGQTFEAAKHCFGLTDGKPDDPKHHQPCPIAGCQCDGDVFYFSPSEHSFHCQKCKFNGDFSELAKRVEQRNRTDTISVRRWSDINETEQSWLWDNKIALGELTLIMGAGGIGKSHFSCFLASHVSNGIPWPDGKPCAQGAVAFFPTGVKERIFKKRLDVNGVNLDKCVLWDKRSIPGDINLGKLAAVEVALDDTEDNVEQPVRLLVIDPVSNFWGEIDTYKISEIKKILTPLEKMAERRNIAIVLIARHEETGQFPQPQIQTSVALTEACHAVWHICQDPKDTGLFFFAPSKTSGCVTPTAAAFRIVKPDGRIEVEETGFIKTIDGFMPETRPKARRGRPPSELEKAMKWLATELAKGEMLYSTIVKRWSKTGGSLDTLKKASRKMGVKKRRKGQGKKARGFWKK